MFPYPPTSSRLFRASETVYPHYVAACRSFLEADAATAPQATLCRRIARYLTEPFTFVADTSVPAANNAAEQSIRPVVIQHKISGGARSPTSSSIFTCLATLFGVWRARGLGPLAACERLLLSQPRPLPI